MKHLRKLTRQYYVWQGYLVQENIIKVPAISIAKFIRKVHIDIETQGPIREAVIHCQTYCVKSSGQ
jgi:hypothetical protein